MLKCDWTHTIIQNVHDMTECVNQFITQRQSIICSAFDTETTGLNIAKDRPFVYQCGWVTTAYKGYSFSIDLEKHPELGKQFIIQMNALFTQSPIHLGHNVKYDMHMLANIGCPYRGHNISDTQCWIRLSSEAIPERKGGVPLALKKFCTQYVTRDAANFEKKLAEERTEKAKQYNARLKRYLGWTKGKIDEFFNDKLNDYTDLPDKQRNGYIDWLGTLPKYLQTSVTGAVSSDNIRYDYLDRAVLMRYAGLDITWTCETYLVTKKIVENHGNMTAMEIENMSIPVLWNMERSGMPADYNYLIESKRRLKEYIRQRRADLEMLAGEPLKCSQSIRVKELAASRFGHPIDTTDKEQMGFLIQDLKRENPDDPFIEFLETIQELRTLEKWYATYICQFVKDMNPDNPKLYTSFNGAGTVSGRLTSNLQQFPKKGIVDRDGNELFNPRKMVVVPEDYSCLVFLDYSALELRCQAMFTVFVMGGDLNMCRAYSPFKCHRLDGTKYDPTNPELVKQWNTGDWYKDEDNTLWTPTDLHSETTKMAFGMDGTEENFHDMRYVGKRTNFAKNYGGSYSVIKRMFPEFSEEQCHKIDEAYYKAFPGVQDFHNWVKAQARQSAYLQNLFGVNYWGSDAHHLCNMLVQGSGAYFMKLKTKELTDFITEHNLKSRIISQVHDENIIGIAPGEEKYVWKFKEIMQKWDNAPIPMIADVEYTTTNWYEKKEVASEQAWNEIWGIA